MVRPARSQWPAAGSITVLALSPVLEALTGYTVAYALAVLGVVLVVWALTRLSRRRMGLRWGDRGSYVAALVYPIGVMTLLGVIAVFSGATRPGTSSLNWLVLELVVIFAVTLIGALFIEEGFFRGWLWGTLEREGRGTSTVLIWTGVVFMLWHLPVASSVSGFTLPVALLPLYLANILFIGLSWGVLRLASGSIVVTSVSHALWNALAYVFFGYGTATGELGIAAHGTIDPERGWLGLTLNVVAFALLWMWYRRR
jgi:membrane protease YdiL (CAAX protease family)